MINVQATPAKAYKLPGLIKVYTHMGYVFNHINIT